MSGNQQHTTMKMKRNICRILVATQLLGIWVASAQNKNNSPIIAVSPSSLSFTAVALGTNADQVLKVQNVGGAKLSGAATVSSPFSIVSGGSYSLAGGHSQEVVVLYTPQTIGTNSQVMKFSGGGGKDVLVSGSAVNRSQPPSPPQNLHFKAIR